MNIVCKNNEKTGKKQIFPVIFYYQQGKKKCRYPRGRRHFGKNFLSNPLKTRTGRVFTDRPRPKLINNYLISFYSSSSSQMLNDSRERVL